MSKNIGKSYITRMRRWHVPRLKGSAKERVSLICDRAFYHDGPFKFKLPRYYRDRLYRKLCDCETIVYNSRTKCCETKIIKRYKSENLLSMQMQAEIRNRIFAQYYQTFGELKSKFPNKSDIEIDFEILNSERSASLFRRQDIYSKMSRFYNYQRFKYRNF